MYAILYFYAICSQANWAFREILQLYLIKIFDAVLRLPHRHHHHPCQQKQFTTKPLHCIKANIYTSIIITFFSQLTAPVADAVNTQPFPFSLTILGQNFKPIATSLCLGFSLRAGQVRSALGQPLLNQWLMGLMQ